MEMWKICRVLNNPIRFALLREIMVSPGRVQNIVQAGERLGIKKSLASQYLKKLSEAGLLMVKRSGRYAMCSSVNLQRSSVARLQIALDEFFRGKHSASDDETVLKTLNALSHHGRIAILRIVADQAGLRFFKLEKAYDLLCGHCAELEKYLSNMDATKDIWQADIRKQMRRDRLPVIWTVIGIAVSIILAMIFG